MATFGNPPPSSALTIGSYQTALCIIPPKSLHPRVDSLRALYDKAHGRWPPHINLIYPFVAVEGLPQAADLIRSKLRELGTGYQNFNLHLDISDHFSHRHSNTIFISPSQESGEILKTLRASILDGFEGGKDEQEYHPHLTIGQTPANAAPMREYLLDKARLLLPVSWQVAELVALVRDKMPQNRNSESNMRIWGSIEISQGTMKSIDRKDLCEQGRSHFGSKDAGILSSIHMPAQGSESYGARRISSVTPRTTYSFSIADAIWKPVDVPIPLPDLDKISSTFKISSYNVLHDPSVTISADKRYPILLKAILDDCALSDVLVLQEVSDNFLSYLLSNKTISSHYHFATHTPIDPLPSLRNIVVLCRWNFSWEYLSVEHRHKGAAVVQLSDVGISKDGSWKPLILVGVHLSSGLTNAGVAARKSQIQALMGYLSSQYSTNPWIIAGDFNIMTNSAVIEDAVATKVISAETANISESLLPMLDERGLVDAWSAITKDSEDDLYGGDAGATFHPLQNPLAAETVRNAGSENMRPRRYDRIYVNGGDLLQVTGFNMFGLVKGISQTSDWEETHSEVASYCGSNHYGIRAIFNVGPFISADMGKLHIIGTQPSRIKLYATAPNLSDPSTLSEFLTKHLALPSETQSQHRKKVLGLLNTIFQSPKSQSSLSPSPNAQPTTILLPVGSYSLETYLPTSDLDILALGTCSASSFFTSATRRLQNSKELGVKIIRRVDAATGTMLELEIKGVRCDLQYCCAPAILPKWREIGELDPLDPIFQLPIQSLQKLNSYRDTEYLKSALPAPQMREFRLAHRFLRIWARERGIYAGKFGFLNGFAITLMLFGIVRRLHPAADKNTVTASNLVCTFFSYYTSFDWTADMVHDAAFTAEKKPYQRNVREVMVVLSLHAPRVNVMRAASLPALRAIREEFQRAKRLLAEPNISWESLFSGPVRAGVGEFLTTHKSYVKIDVHYWGASAAAASSLLGWLESKCVALLVDLNRKLPHIQARIWPARFALCDEDSKRITDEQHQWYYLIGLRRMESVKKSISDSDRKLAQNALRTALESFADLIREDEKYFDSSTSWVDVGHIKQSDIGELKLDKGDWGADTDVYQQFESGEDQESEDKDGEIIFSNDSDDEEAEASTARTKSKATQTKKSSKANTNPVSSNKLRPASDILSRLRWDPDLDSNDYVVGYIDRFLGTKEQGLETWKSEQTDEEFIPQHRIVYFRRKSDDVRVWDRQSRLDLIFGSGVGKK